MSFSCHLNPMQTRGGRPTDHGCPSQPNGCSGYRKGIFPLAISDAGSPWLCGGTGRFGLTLRADCKRCGSGAVHNGFCVFSFPTVIQPARGRPGSTREPFMDGSQCNCTFVSAVPAKKEYAWTFEVRQPPSEPDGLANAPPLAPFWMRTCGASSSGCCSLLQLPRFASTFGTQRLRWMRSSYTNTAQVGAALYHPLAARLTPLLAGRMLVSKGDHGERANVGFRRS